MAPFQWRALRQPRLPAAAGALALATGALARRLGARRTWPLAAFLVALTPAVLRFAATQYVDVFTAACLVAALYFGLRWLREPARAAMGGRGGSPASGSASPPGAKVLGIGYGLRPSPRGSSSSPAGAWSRRAAQIAAMLVLVAGLGGFFYLRNAPAAVDPLALKAKGCRTTSPSGRCRRYRAPTPSPRCRSACWARESSSTPFAGTVAPGRIFADLGVGPQVFLLLLAAGAMPFALRARRREALVATGSLLAILAVWATVPYAASGHVYANVRYLDPALGIAFAGGGRRGRGPGRERDLARRDRHRAGGAGPPPAPRGD